jgi:hypothetical protein
MSLCIFQLALGPLHSSLALYGSHIMSSLEQASIISLKAVRFSEVWDTHLSLIIMVNMTFPFLVELACPCARSNWLRSTLFFSVWITHIKYSQDLLPNSLWTITSLETNQTSFENELAGL